MSSGLKDYYDERAQEDSKRREEEFTKLKEVFSSPEGQTEFFEKLAHLLVYTRDYDLRRLKDDLLKRFG